MNPFIFAVLPLLWSVPAIAHQTVPAPGLRSSALATVFVQDLSGTETTGKLLRLDDTSVVVLVDGREVDFDLAQVWSVKKRGDSLKNGAIIGTVVGAAFGLLGGAMADCGSYEEGYGPCGAGARLGYAAGSAAVYALIGMGIDALIPGRTTLYQRPVVSIASTVRPRGGAVAFTFSW